MEMTSLFCCFWQEKLKADADAEGVNVVGTDTVAECRQEVVCEWQGGTRQRPSTDAEMGTELPGIEDVDFFAGAMPSVIGTHGACGKMSFDEHSSDSKIEPEWC